MSRELDGIAADKDLVGGVKDKLVGWIDELGLLADFAANGERTGVPPDPRSTERAKSLLHDVEAWHARFDGGDSSNSNFTAQKRVMRVTMEALCSEAKKVAQGLRVRD